MRSVIIYTQCVLSLFITYPFILIFLRVQHNLYKVITCLLGTLSNYRRLKHNIVNKRKTLAETTPESILLAAKVAGKSKKVKTADSNSTSCMPATANEDSRR